MDYLAERGIRFEEREVSSNDTYRRELYRKHRSFSTPTLVVGSKVLVGFDRNQWDREVRNG